MWKLSCTGSCHLLLLFGGFLSMLDLMVLLFCLELGSLCRACYYPGPNVDLVLFGRWLFGGVFHQFVQVSILDGSKCGLCLQGLVLSLCGRLLCPCGRLLCPVMSMDADPNMYPILIPPASNTFHFCHHPQPLHSQPYHTQSIIYHPSFVINGNSQYQAYSITVLIFPIFNRPPSPLRPPLNSVK